MTRRRCREYFSSATSRGRWPRDVKIAWQENRRSVSSFNLTGDIGSMALAFGNIFSAGNGFRDIGASVTQPIFDGGTLMHRERAFCF